MLTSKFKDKLLSKGLMYEFGFLIECSGTLLNFSPCSTFDLYLLHIRITYLRSKLPLPEGQAGTAWGLSYP
jgi:hypothetical protein